MVVLLIGDEKEELLTGVVVQPRAVLHTEVNYERNCLLTDHVMPLSGSSHAPWRILGVTASSSWIWTHPLQTQVSPAADSYCSSSTRMCVCVRQFLFVHLCGCIMQTCVCVPCLMIHYCPQVFKRRHYCITFNLKIHKWNATNESSGAGKRLWLYSAEHLPPSAPFCSPRPRPTPIPVPCNEKPLIMTIGLVFLRSMCPSVPPPLLSLSSEIRALCAYVWTEGIVCVCVFTICESLMMLLLSKLWGRFITPISVLWWL